MSDPSRIRRQQILREAEGYLDLITVFGDRMPCRPDARDTLARRVLDDARPHRESRRPEGPRALPPRPGPAGDGAASSTPCRCFREAAEIEPQNIHIRLSLGLVLQALPPAGPGDSVARRSPRSRRLACAIVHYNLACYWSLAGNVKLAVTYLSQAFDLEPEYRDLVHRERDFDPIRNHPHFQALTA